MLTDLMMPRLDGLGLIERLRIARVPIRGIIAMSAVHGEGQRLAGVDLFIAKPFELEQVVASVWNLLSP